jgi:hypothetical protein
MVKEYFLQLVKTSPIFLATIVALSLLPTWTIGGLMSSKIIFIMKII